MITTAREEQYLAKFAGEDVPIPEPKTRTEMYLAKMAGMDVDPPAPITREEQILSAIAENGGGGGGGGGDFSTANVSIDNRSGNSIDANIFIVNTQQNAIGPLAGIMDDMADTIIVPLYKGNYVCAIFPNEETITISGDITELGGGYYMITGDCTITISMKK